MKVIAYLPMFICNNPLLRLDLINPGLVFIASGKFSMKNMDTVSTEEIAPCKTGVKFCPDIRTEFVPPL